MNCNWYQDRLLLYLSGEIRDKDRSRLMHHLAVCEECVALAEELARTFDHVTEHCPADIAAPPTLVARVMHTIGTLPPRPAQWIPSRAGQGYAGFRTAIAMAGAVFLLLIGFAAGYHLSLVRGSGSNYVRVAPPVLDSAVLAEIHEKSLDMGTASEVRDPVVFARELTERAGFKVAVADLSDVGLRLLGGGVEPVCGIEAACLRYASGASCTTLLQIRGDAGVIPGGKPVQLGGREFITGTAAGVAFVAWHSKNDTFVLVCCTPPDRLLNLARLVSTRVSLT
ncbi:MAG: anti-sigma factor family protein [Chthonomonadales bacterium]